MQRQKTIIHFVRHGEVDNPSSLRYGRLPGFHLSEAGRRQVEDLSLFFTPRKISRIYTSPLERTQQTATILGLAFPYAAITIDARLIEAKTSRRFEGKPRTPGFFYPEQETTDAESAEAIVERLAHFVEEKIIAHNGSEIIAVTHADPIAFLYSKLVYNNSSVIYDPYPAYASTFSYVYLGLELQEIWYYVNNAGERKSEVGRQKL